MGSCRNSEKQNDLWSKGVWGFIFNDNVLNHQFQKVRAYILIGFAFVDGGVHFLSVENIDLHD